MRVLGEEEVQVLDVILLREQCTQLAMFNVPLVELRRERVLELVDVRFDAFCVRVLLWRIDLAFMAQRCKASEVVIVLGEFERLIGEVIFPFSHPTCQRMARSNRAENLRSVSRTSGRS